MVETRKYMHGCSQRLAQGKNKQGTPEFEGWVVGEGSEGWVVGEGLTIPKRTMALERRVLGNRVVIPRKAVVPTKAKMKVRKSAKHLSADL